MRNDAPTQHSTFSRGPRRARPSALLIHTDGELERLPLATCFALVGKGLAELDTEQLLVFVADD